MAKAAKTRMCLMCRETFAQDELLRFVLDPNNNLILDLYGKAPARGNYICKDEKCLEKALDKQVLLKMLKANKTNSFKEDVMASLNSKITGDIKMLKKAQLFVPGAEQVGDLLRANKADFVLFSTDISDSSKDKILAKVDKTSTQTITCLTKDQLSDVVSIANCSVLAFKRSKLTTSLKNTLKVYVKLQKS